MLIFYTQMNYLKKVDKWVPRCNTLGVEGATIIDVLNLNSMRYHCILKTILSGNGLSV